MTCDFWAENAKNKNSTAKAEAIISRFALRASLRPSAEWSPLIAPKSRAMNEAPGSNSLSYSPSNQTGSVAYAYDLSDGGGVFDGLEEGMSYVGA